jgi:hypothetical protein
MGRYAYLPEREATWLQKRGLLTRIPCPCPLVPVSPHTFAHSRKPRLPSLDVRPNPGEAVTGILYANEEVRSMDGEATDIPATHHQIQLSVRRHDLLGRPFQILEVLS